MGGASSIPQKQARQGVCVLGEWGWDRTPLGLEREIPFELRNDKVIMGTGSLCVINLTCFYVAQNPGTPGDSQSTQGLCTMGNGWGMPSEGLAWSPGTGCVSALLNFIAVEKKITSKKLAK